MNRTWKSIKRDSNKTKIYLTIALLSDEVFNRCSNDQSLIPTESGRKWVEWKWMVRKIDDFESTRTVIHINKNWRSLKPMQKVIEQSEQNLNHSLLNNLSNPHGPSTFDSTFATMDRQLFPRPFVPRPCDTPITVDMDPMTRSRDIFNVKWDV